MRRSGDGIWPASPLACSCAVAPAVPRPPGAATSPRCRSRCAGPGCKGNGRRRGGASARLPPCAASRAATGSWPTASPARDAPALGRRGGPAFGSRRNAQRATRAGTWRRCSSGSPGEDFRPEHRRRLRLAHGRRAASVPGLGGPHTGRRRRAGHGERAEQARFRARRSGWFSPVSARIGDRFGPRGNGFHPGVDFPAPTGTPVGAAGRGRSWSSPAGTRRLREAGGDRAPLGVRSMYAHLSRIEVRTGRRGGRGIVRRPRRHDRFLDRPPPSLRAATPGSRDRPHDRAALVRQTQHERQHEVARNTIAIPKPTSRRDPYRWPSTPMPNPAPNSTMKGHGDVEKSGDA